MIMSKKRQDQEPLLFANQRLAYGILRRAGRPDFKLVARRNHKFLSHFRLIGQGTNHRFTRWRECPILVGGRLPLGNDGHKVDESTQSLAHKSSTVVYDLSATVYCI
jgi:hypothetical protein